MSKFQISKNSAFLPKSEQIQQTENLIEVILEVLDDNNNLQDSMQLRQQKIENIDFLISKTYMIIGKFFSQKDIKRLFENKFEAFSHSLNDFLQNQLVALDMTISEINDIDCIQLKNQFQEIAENVVYGNHIYLFILINMSNSEQLQVFQFLDKSQQSKVKFAVVSITMANDKIGQLMASVEYLVDGKQKRSVWDYRTV
ncbi:hypothetical protein SS50377_25318 [Spironucleus salmonicida]|uniref:Uncharacterized protein n=1 Tax=Spironucleus salmonicida TaxID=348837 RepID=V6LBK8_9EUKA|nr:hypothetical protein SS50377_25318 [Spironucleus salmonicida]|eukprot:EST41802.1 Hypothetical protein SS50377_18635 [Spironucleus salmonicida]